MINYYIWIKPIPSGKNVLSYLEVVGSLSGPTEVEFSSISP